MNIQIIHGEKGKPTGVFIPIKDWEIIKKNNPKIEEKAKKSLKKVPNETELYKNLKVAFKELKLVLDGKLEARPAREILNEL